MISPLKTHAGYWQCHLSFKIVGVQYGQKSRHFAHKTRNWLDRRLSRRLIGWASQLFVEVKRKVKVFEFVSAINIGVLMQRNPGPGQLKAEGWVMILLCKALRQSVVVARPLFEEC
jgi:hypothetical protein